ncbi:hypothetical protein HYU45_04925 [Candidatus Daviesbacteria bacterium]|nr:hypothetical protein [Candidatus Daviesbacteria bacterium]
MAIEIDPLAYFKALGERFSGENLLSRRTRAEPDTESKEIVDPLQTIAGLQKKAGIMVKMIESGEVEQPYIEETRKWFRLYVSNLVWDGGVEGLDNLQRAITQARSEKKRLVFTPSHLADADHPIATYLMEYEGRGLGVQDELVWMAGVNMLRRPKIERYMRAENLLYNVTPRDTDHLQELKDHKYNLDESQIDTLEEIKKIFNRMNFAAMRRLVETCIKGKNPLVVYIEGGRSYDPDGFLYPPLLHFSGFFPKDDSVIVVPYRVYGSRELNPPGKEPPFLRKELIPGFRQRVSMIVGESYPSSEIWEVQKQREAEATVVDGKKVEINPMDWVMANIANLDPSYVRPEEQRYYGDLMKRFAPLRNRIVIPDEVAT